MDREQALAIMESFMEQFPTARGEIQEAIEVLSSPQWISIDEDLPYKHENLLVGNETVLVVVADIFGNVDTDFMTYNEGVWNWWSNSNAVYWLPLPEFTDY